MISLLSTFSDYLARTRPGKRLAVAEFLNSLIYFSAKAPYTDEGDVDASELADNAKYDDMVCDVPLSMEWMEKTATYGSQKYTTIRDDLEVLGLFTIERQKSGQGKSQPITRLLGVNYRAVVELLQRVFLSLDESLVPAHGFTFLRRWHENIFGFHLGDRVQGEAQRNDPDAFWLWAFKHRAIAAFNREVESRLLREEGWGEGFEAKYEWSCDHPDLFDYDLWMDTVILTAQELEAKKARNLVWINERIADGTIGRTPMIEPLPGAFELALREVRMNG